ncbi:hypothetical protein [Azospirillum sp. sgz301742]
MQPFRPTGATIEIAVTAASLATQLVGGADSVRLEAPASGSVHVGFGKSGDTIAFATSLGLLAGSVEVLGVPAGATHILTFGSGAVTLRVTPGVGA